jgi:hypothetical protein
MSILPAHNLTIIVLCPRLAPVAHGTWCSFRHLFLSPKPDRPGDWCETVTDLDQIRARFPGVLFHNCLLDALPNAIPAAEAPPVAESPPPQPAACDPEPERRPRGEHPYGRT